MKVYIVINSDVDSCHFEVDSVHLTEKSANARAEYANTCANLGIHDFMKSDYFKVEEHEVTK